MANTAAQFYEKYDPTFKQDLQDSKAAVWLAARWISSRLQCDVTVLMTPVRNKVEDISDYSDAGDLRVTRPNGTAERIEVKRRGFAFSGAADYPFDTVIVDVKHSWDRADPKPTAYLILDKTMKHLAIVKADSAPQWTEQTRFDKAKNRTRAFYFCPLSMVRFYEVGEIG